MRDEAMSDERTPLLSAAAEEVTARPSNGRKRSADIIDFDPEGDVSNPQEWSRQFKWGAVALLALMAFTTYVKRITSDVFHFLPLSTAKRHRI
jgi:hypothetical protein